MRVVEGGESNGRIALYVYGVFSFLLGLRFCDGDIPPYALHHTLVFPDERLLDCFGSLLM